MEEVYISYKGNIFVECKINIGTRTKFFLSFGFDGDNISTSTEKTKQSVYSKLTPWSRVFLLNLTVPTL